MSELPNCCSVLCRASFSASRVSAEISRSLLSWLTGEPWELNWAFLNWRELEAELSVLFPDRCRRNSELGETKIKSVVINIRLI